MTLPRYLVVVISLVCIGVTTVAEHVERVRIGYEIRQLKTEKRRLQQELKQQQLVWTRTAAIENVVRRALSLGLFTEQDLEVLPVSAQHNSKEIDQ